MHKHTRGLWVVLDNTILVSSFVCLFSHLHTAHQYPQQGLRGLLQEQRDIRAYNKPQLQLFDQANRHCHTKWLGRKTRRNQSNSYGDNIMTPLPRVSLVPLLVGGIGWCPSLAMQIKWKWTGNDWKWLEMTGNDWGMRVLWYVRCHPPSLPPSILSRLRERSGNWSLARLDFTTAGGRHLVVVRSTQELPQSAYQKYETISHEKLKFPYADRDNIRINLM